MDLLGVLAGAWVPMGVSGFWKECSVVFLCFLVSLCFLEHVCVQAGRGHFFELLLESKTLFVSILPFPANRCNASHIQVESHLSKLAHAGTRCFFFGGADLTHHQFNCHVARVSCEAVMLMLGGKYAEPTKEVDGMIRGRGVLDLQLYCTLSTYPNHTEIWYRILVFSFSGGQSSANGTNHPPTDPTVDGRNRTTWKPWLKPLLVGFKRESSETGVSQHCFNSWISQPSCWCWDK